MSEIYDLYSRYRRGKTEPPELRAFIEEEGGRVIEQRQIGQLLKSPFKGLRIYPMLYEFHVRYGNRRGHWYVRTSRDGVDPDWAWHDQDGIKGLPVERDAVSCEQDPKPTGMLEDLVRLFVMLGVGITLFLVIYFWVL